MKNNLLYTADNNNLNPYFQHHLPQGRMQALDFAFFMKKYSFMQQPVQEILPGKKEDERVEYNDDDRV